MKIRNQHCPNAKCKLYGQLEKNNIQIHSKKNKRFRCSLCYKTWSENFNEIYFCLKSSIELLNRAKTFLDLGLSVRQIARRIDVSPSTIQKWKLKF